MAITEEDRYELFKSLEEVLGRDRASTLMEHLPPVGWADVATKGDLALLETATRRDIEQLEIATRRDIEQLELSMESRFERADGRLDQVADQLRAEFRLDTRNIVFAMVASNATFAALVIAATRLG